MFFVDVIYLTETHVAPRMPGPLLRPPRRLPLGRLAFVPALVTAVAACVGPGDHDRFWRGGSSTLVAVPGGAKDVVPLLKSS